MTSGEAYGAVVVAIVAIGGFLSFSSIEKANNAEDLYPGQPIARHARTRSYLVSAYFMVLLLWAIFCNSIGMPLIGFFVVALVVTGIGCAIQYLNKRFLPLKIRQFRVWVACTAVWLLATAAYYVIFERSSRLYDKDFIWLGVLPPLVLAAAMTLYSWAMKAPRND